MEIARRRQEECSVKRHVRLATRCPLGALVQRVPPNVIKVTKDICMVACRIVWLASSRSRIDPCQTQQRRLQAEQIECHAYRSQHECNQN
jgi:hypothetical protein